MRCARRVIRACGDQESIVWSLTLAAMRLPGKVVLVFALIGLLAAGVAVAKKKHHHGNLPRGPYPSLGGCPVFPASSAAASAPSAADESAWNQDISAAPPDPNSAAYISYIAAHGG